MLFPLGASAGSKEEQHPKVRHVDVKAVIIPIIPFILQPPWRDPVPSQLGRRTAEEAKIAYAKNSRRVGESLETQNAGLRIVADEREKYRQRQT